MGRKVTVNLGARSYDIIIGAGLLDTLGERLNELGLGRTVLLVSDEQVWALHGARVRNSLENAGFRVVPAVVPPGEEQKDLARAEELYDLAYGGGLDRTCPVVALGGGVVGDLAGFVAATYMRGVPLVNVPTTLLAQVDSSIGGKVAVNHPRGKNIIGAFYQPRLVLADVATLTTLPQGELLSGLAEVVKYGVIADASFFAWLEAYWERVLARDTAGLERVVRHCSRIKAWVVERDETEQGLRAILNYGHTVGHALEAATGYRRFSHGEAVAVGMAVAARLAERLGMLAPPEGERIRGLLVRVGLPVTIPADVNTEELLEALYRDKKVVGGRLTFVLPVNIGEVRVRRDVPEGLVRCLLEEFREGD
ncbi:MAG: 3-dehydroquinate synthase [Desulfotomaculales bacterium]